MIIIITIIIIIIIIIILLLPSLLLITDPSRSRTMEREITKRNIKFKNTSRAKDIANTMGRVLKWNQWEMMADISKPSSQ